MWIRIADADLAARIDTVLEQTRETIRATRQIIDQAKAVNAIQRAESDTHRAVGHQRSTNTLSTAS
jgi:hypothetical protein